MVAGPLSFDWRTAGRPRAVRAVAAACLLIAARLAAGGSPAPIDAAFEPNEEIAQAVVVGPGEFQGVVATPEDRDYFAVDLAGGDALLVRIAFRHDDGDLDLKILNAEGTPLSSSSSSTDDEQVYWRGVEGERYYFRVNGYAGATNSYAATVTVLANGGAPDKDDPFEDNDTPETATPAGSLGEREPLSLLDEDWFRLDVDEHDTVRAEAYFVDAIGDVDLYLLDGAGEEIAAATSNTDDERLVAQFLPAGAYYLRAIGFKPVEEDGGGAAPPPADTNYYELTIRVEAPSGPARLEPLRAASEFFAFDRFGEANARPGGPGTSASGASAPRGETIRSMASAKEEQPILPGEFLVEWASPAALAEFQALASRSSSEFEARPLNGFARKPPARAGAFDSPAGAAWTLVRSRSLSGAAGRVASAEDLEEFEKALRTLPGVASLEPNRLWRVADTPSYQPPELDLGRVPYYALSGLPAMWGRSLGEGVVVAVIDTGLDFGHPDLAPRAIRNLAELNGQPGVDDDGNGYVDDIDGWDFVSVDPINVREGEDAYPPDNDPLDRHGHGTAVAGVALAGEGGPGADFEGAPFNMVGVAPRAKLMVLRAGWAAPSGQGLLSTADWVEAIYYAADNGAHVLNMSFADNVASTAARAAVEHAARRGCVLVAAAGNQGFYTPRYPAAFPGVIAVGSVDESLRRSSFSNFGPWVDVQSFGDNVIVSDLGGGYRRWSGTSFSSPFVAGVAALAISEWGLSAPETAARMRLSAQSLDEQNPNLEGFLGWGLARADSIRSKAEQEERGEHVRVFVRNSGQAPCALDPAALIADPVFCETPVVGFGDPERVLPGDERVVVFSAPIFAKASTPGDLEVFQLAAETAEAPAARAFAKALPPGADPGQVLFRENFADPGRAWTPLPFEPSAALPFEPGTLAAINGAPSLSTSGPAQLALSSGELLEARGAGSLLAVEVRLDAASLLPAGAGAQVRLHSGDWNDMVSAWIYGPQAGNRTTTILLPEGAPELGRGLRGGADLMASASAVGGATIRIAEWRVRSWDMPSLGAGARVDRWETPSLASGWIARAPGNGVSPGLVEDVVAIVNGLEVPGGTRVSLKTNMGAAGWIESPTIGLEAGRLYRARFSLRSEAAQGWLERPAVLLFAYREDGAGAGSRLFESLPGQPSAWLDRAPTDFDFLFRTTSDGLGGGAFRLGAGLQSADAANAEATSAIIEKFELTSVPDPLQP